MRVEEGRGEEGGANQRRVQTSFVKRLFVLHRLWWFGSFGSIALLPLNDIKNTKRRRTEKKIKKSKREEKNREVMSGEAAPRGEWQWDGSGNRFTK